MIIECLGTAGYHPSQTRHTSCYYVPELKLLLDAGSGIFRLTPRLKSEPVEQLDILLSHAHLDHVFGLSFLLEPMAVTSLKRVRVFGLESKLAAIQEHLFNPHLFPVPVPLEFEPLSSERGQMHLETATVHWFPLEHPGGSTGYRIECEAGCFAYVTDTTAQSDAEYVRDLSNLDLLLHECNFDDNAQDFAQKTGHSWLGGVVEVVRKCAPRKTYLVHIDPLEGLLHHPLSLSQAERELGIECAKDEQRIEFGVAD